MNLLSKFLRLGEPPNRSEIEAQLKAEHYKRDAAARMAVDNPELLDRILGRRQPRRRGPEIYRMETKVRDA
jgi:hypothetical protein